MNIIAITSRFNTQEKCIKHLELIRWEGQAICPYCGSERASRLKGELRHHCNACNKSFSVLIGTIFEDTNLPLPKWFAAISLILNAKKGISSRQLSRDIGIHKDTAWYLQMRVRSAMEEPDMILNGIIEIDETFIGGRLSNKTKKYRKQRDEAGLKPSGMEHRQAVLGIMQRNGKVLAKVIKKATGAIIKPIIREHISKESTLITDGFGGYAGLNKEYKDHQIINHQEDEFVRGEYHTNSIEGFWSLIKRSIMGQFHHISIPYMHLYIDECTYKFNNRLNENLFGSFLTTTLKTNTT